AGPSCPRCAATGGDSQAVLTVRENHVRWRPRARERARRSVILPAVMPRRVAVVIAALATLATALPVAAADTIGGTPRADRLIGTPGPDTIRGRGGNDRIRGRGG